MEMLFVKIFTYEQRDEYIRADQIESVVMPTDTNNGRVNLLGGRSIALGSKNAARLLLIQLTGKSTEFYDEPMKN